MQVKERIQAATLMYKTGESFDTAPLLTDAIAAREPERHIISAILFLKEQDPLHLAHVIVVYHFGFRTTTEKIAMV